MGNEGVQPKMGWSHGELEIKVNGRLVYSYKKEHPLPAVSELLRRVRTAMA